MTNTSFSDAPPDSTREVDFIPKGAVVFFVLLLGFFALVWLGMYALMIGHAG